VSSLLSFLFLARRSCSNVSPFPLPAVPFCERASSVASSSSSPVANSMDCVSLAQPRAYTIATNLEHFEFLLDILVVTPFLDLFTQRLLFTLQ
jgi:hypothetical protein